MNETPYIKLPESELEVMQLIWDLHAAGVEEIHATALFAHSPALGRLKLTTVLTLIQRLSTKGFISIRKAGKVNCYTPLVDEAAYKDFATKNFLETVYHNDAAGLLSALLGGDCLSKEDIARLKAYIDAAEGADPKSE